MIQCFVFSLLLVPGIALQLYNHGSSSLNNPAWMGQLDNGIPIRELSIFGTHSSMGTGVWGDAFQTQGNSLTNQMVMGFRALDIRCRHKDNQFPVHDRLVYLNTNLGAVLATVKSFLLSYPSEAILMHIVEEYNPSGNTQSFEQTYISYRNSYSDVIWVPTTQNPLLGEVRGKIVIIQDFPGTQTHGLLYSTFTVLPHKQYSTNWDQYDRWVAVKTFLGATNSAGASRISFWTGNVGSFPYFVASGKSSPGNNDPRLLTGALSFKSSTYPDFPRVACLGTLCTILFEGINILAYNYLIAQNYNYLGIIFTDFLGDDVLARGISLNTGKFTPCPLNLITQGCTYCSSSSQCLGCNSTTHYLYLSSNFSCAADTGYFLNWTAATVNEATQCSAPMPGCLACSSSVFCVECDILANYKLVNNDCGAAFGYYLNALQIPVLCPIMGCYDCLSASVCITCSAVNNFVLNSSQLCQCDAGNLFMQHPSAPACICFTGYFLNNGTCEAMPLCPDPSSGCLSCSATPSCLLCDSGSHFETDPANTALCRCQAGYYFNGSLCLACTDALSGACLECASSDLCLSCDSNFTLQNGDCVCLPSFYQFDANTCLPCATGCLRCTTSPTCLVCDTANNFTKVAGVCECLPGMFLNVNQCQPCGSMAGCLTCDMNGCTSCDPMFGFSLNVTLGVCECNPGYFINSMDVCEQCTAEGCLECDDQSTCTVCTSTYYLSGGVCLEICGDGLLFNLECDDGNTINGDGCSSVCRVETDYTCVGGTSTTPSTCSFSGTLLVSITLFKKDPSQNKVYLQATVTPALAELATIDFSTAFVPNFPVASKSTTFINSSGVIDMVFTYDQPLNNMDLSVELVPPLTPATMYMQNSTTILPRVTSNNLALKVYSEDLYGMTDKEDASVLALALVALVLFILCFFLVSKLMGVEMMLIFQLAYAALLILEKKELLMVSFRNLWVANGYNNLLHDSAQSVPQRLQEIYYKGAFLANFNLNIVLGVLPLTIGLILWSVGKCRTHKTTRVRAYLALKEWQISCLLFVQMHLGVSLCIAYKYDSQNIMGLALGFLLYLCLLTLLVLLARAANNFGEYKFFFRKGTIPQNWYIVVGSFRVVLGLVVGLLWDSNYCGYVLVGVVLFWAALGIIVRPYVSNVRPIVNSILLLAVVGIYCLCAATKDSEDVTFLTSYVPLILLGVLALALAFNLICIIVYKVRQSRKEENQKLSQDMLDEDQNSSKQIDQNYIMHLKEQLRGAPMLQMQEGMSLDEENPLRSKRKETKSLKESIIIELREGVELKNSGESIQNKS